MARLVWADRKATVTRITTVESRMHNKSNLGLQSQKNTSGSSSVRQEQKADAAVGTCHQNWTAKDCKNAWSGESFLLRYTDGRVRISHQRHESMDQTCLLSTVQAGGGGVMVWGMFSWHTESVNTNQSLLECHSLSEYCCWPSLHGHNVPIFQWLLPAWSCTVSQCKCHLKLVSWTWQWVQCSFVVYPVTGFQSNRTPLGCGRTGDSQHEYAAGKLLKLRDAIMSTWNRISKQRNVFNILWNPCHKELWLFWAKGGPIQC